jgi:polyisoprenoid-binding protein YceI
MKKTMLILATLFFWNQDSFSQKTDWKLDAVHSNVKFSVQHMVISEMDGSFKAFDGSIQNSKTDFTDAVINFSVDVNSINTDNSMRDGHLKGDDFFNAEKYPAMTFKSSSLKKVSGNKYTLTGDLTIRDVTKKVSFNVTYGGTAKDPYGNVKSGFKASGKINRFDYGLKWNTLTEAGGAMVGKDINITLNLEFAQKKA